jgi:hypothetical protein
MPDPHGQTLLVNISASDARRRLKGFGHGVRKVQSAGRNQAAIIHTATGRHLEELKRKFADVGFSGGEGGRIAASPPSSAESSIIQPNSGLTQPTPAKTRTEPQTLEFG